MIALGYEFSRLRLKFAKSAKLSPIGPFSAVVELTVAVAVRCLRKDTTSLSLV